MGIITNFSNNSRSTNKYIKLLIRLNRSICALLYCVGIIWFCCLAHPQLNNGTYFSENALLPGLVYSEMKSDSSNLANSLFQEMERERVTHKNTMPRSWILAKMKQIGLEAYSHNFTLNYPLGGGLTFTGNNVYGILRAPRIASTEAFVISVPYRTPDSIHPKISYGLPLMLAFADYARKRKFWAKDIIFLVTDQEQLGVQAWLDAYHNDEENNYLKSGNIEGRAGAIQAAINLELEDFDIEYINIKLEGLNGQLPNLDLVNLVQKLSYKEGIPCGHKQRNTIRRSGEKSRIKDNLNHMMQMVMTQSTGVPNGNHGLFHRYGIEAITLECHKKQSTYYQKSINGAFSLLKIIEGVSRSINNLLERFHQSYFFYLMVASDRFISIGDYMPSIAVMAASLFVKAIIIYLSFNNRNKDNNAEENDETKTTGDDTTYFNILTLGVIFIIAHILGFLTSYLPFNMSLSRLFFVNNISTELSLLIIILLITLIGVLSPLFFNLGYHGTKALHILVLLEVGTALIGIGMVNFSLSFILCIIIVPFGIIVETWHPNNSSKLNWLLCNISRLLCIFFHPLMVVYTAVALLTYHSFNELPIDGILKRAFPATLDSVTFSVVDSIIYGNWMYNLMCFIFLPSWILFWNVIFSKNQQELFTLNINNKKVKRREGYEKLKTQ